MCAHAAHWSCTAKINVRKKVLGETYMSDIFI